jgi:hypothetical protein
MIEAIKHALGLCGEHWHPNIFTLLLSGVGLLPTYSYIKYTQKEIEVFNN